MIACIRVIGIRDLFTFQIWNGIVKKLNNKHSQNLINSSPFFRHLLLHKRVSYMVEDILKVLVTTEIGDVCSRGRCHWNYKNETDVKALILNCRLTCQAWNNAIGKLAQISNPDWKRSPEPDYSKLYVVSHLLRESHDFSSITKTEKFLEVFGNLADNPFIGRTITIMVTPFKVPDNHFDLYHSLITTLLQTFGHHIFYCTIYSISNENSYEVERLYMYQVEWLCNLPNLRHLGIKFPNNKELHQPHIMKWPPVLKKLQSLTSKHVSGSFANAIIGNNLHVSKLIIHSSLHNLGRVDLHYNFEKLESLELLVNAIDLKDIIVPSWNCGTFKLKVRPYGLTGFSRDSFSIKIEQKWHEIFDVLRTKFGSIVDELDVSLFGGYTLESVKQCVQDSVTSRLKLAKIKKLDLTWENMCACDFLLGVKDTLEELNIQWQYDVYTHPPTYASYRALKPELKFLGYVHKMYESNIWELFPKLKVLTINFPDRIYQYNRKFLSVASRSN